MSATVVASWPNSCSTATLSWPRLDPDMNDDDPEVEGQLLSHSKTNASMGVDKRKEKTSAGGLTNSYKFKPHGLMNLLFKFCLKG